MDRIKLNISGEGVSYSRIGDMQENGILYTSDRILDSSKGIDFNLRREKVLDIGGGSISAAMTARGPLEGIGTGRAFELFKSGDNVSIELLTDFGLILWTGIITSLSVCSGEVSEFAFVSSGPIMSYPLN